MTSRIAAIRCGAWLSSASTSSVCSPSSVEAVTVGFIAENLSGLPAGQWLARASALQDRVDLAVMCVMSEIMAHTITLHLLDVPGRVHRLMRKYAESSGRTPKHNGPPA